MYVLNEKLNKALKRANVKITEVKEKYKNKISQKCYYCNNDLELSVNLGTTFDQVNVTTAGEMDKSFVVPGSESNDGNDSFGDKLGQEEGDGDINLLDNLLVEENNP